MSILSEKLAAAKARKELKRTDPEAYLNLISAQNEPEKRFIVQYYRTGVWNKLFSTDDQAQALDYIIVNGYNHKHLDLSWRVWDAVPNFARGKHTGKKNVEHILLYVKNRKPFNPTAPLPTFSNQGD